MKKTLVLLSLLLSLVSAQDSRQTVAVIDFDASGISQLEATSLTNRFRTAVGDVGVMRLVERGMMEEVLQEQDFQKTGYGVMYKTDSHSDIIF